MLGVEDEQSAPSGSALLRSVGLNGDGLPGVPCRQSGLVISGCDPERHLAEKDSQRRLVGVDHLEDGGSGGPWIARRSTGSGAIPSVSDTGVCRVFVAVLGRWSGPIG